MNGIEFLKIFQSDKIILLFIQQNKEEENLATIGKKNFAHFFAFGCNYFEWVTK